MDDVEGSVYACIDGNIPPGCVVGFDTGCGASPLRSGEALAAWLTERLGSGATVIVEDAVMSTSDPVFESRADDSIIRGHEVYHWRTFSPIQLTGLGRFLISSTAYPLNAVVLPGKRHFVRAQSMTSDDIVEWAQAADVIIVGAYDNEGFVIWQAA